MSSPAAAQIMRQADAVKNTMTESKKSCRGAGEFEPFSLKQPVVLFVSSDDLPTFKLDLPFRRKSAAFGIMRGLGMTQMNWEAVKKTALSVEEEKIVQIHLSFVAKLLETLLQHTPKEDSKARDFLTLSAVKVLYDWLYLNKEILQWRDFSNSSSSLYFAVPQEHRDSDTTKVLSASECAMQTIMKKQMQKRMEQVLRIIEIGIRQCRSSGIDCRSMDYLYQLGTKLSDDDIPTLSPFLLRTKMMKMRNSKEMEVGIQHLLETRKGKSSSSKDIQTYVFVSEIKMPVLNETLSALNCVQIAGGSKSLFCVTQDGKVYACGEGTNGRLGLGSVAGNVYSRQLTTLGPYVIKKVAVHSGGRHALALSIDGKVFAWGEGDDGEILDSQVECDGTRWSEGGPEVWPVVEMPKDFGPDR
ncbi:E3 ubiquitin-protein ligase herc2 [Bulinus truncatus]|nr:E3 ubiquitin-protein ligase herc2 [Bulinus truncatus]